MQLYCWRDAGWFKSVSTFLLPLTSSPVAFPGCPDGQKYFKLSIVTDNYGSKTSWKVTSSTNNNVASGGGYLNNNNLQ
eukprot:9443439-Ditylum_brightwellii.AAC.1